MQIYKHSNIPNTKRILKASIESDRKIKVLHVSTLAIEASDQGHRGIEIVSFKYIQHIIQRSIQNLFKHLRWSL